MSNTTKPNQAQKDAMAQLKAAFAACEAADLKVLATCGDPSGVEVGVSDFDHSDGKPVVVLWLGDDRSYELESDPDAEFEEEVHEIVEKHLERLGRDADNAWPQICLELESLWCDEGLQLAKDEARIWLCELMGVELA